ncbi:TPA: hypothetical protein DEQ22_02070 [Candidatus Nomurabacteria bacterium]|uniref:Uncharacterized protein n=1 Tax=Candidatus Nomurabacteria bacterium RIFOXYA2_FULL_42_12 TaxID=1801801 RepID=A0A1F6YPS2_9BACT|nr:MAG: hypothetical protein UV13_C0004G0014 [Parcubacteria group bacterium GW2011_GWC1_42_21]KKS56486.1 MAG: hypothetical protein UV23_C0041G0006 [Candidatus Nomurabacteria bacterium GW2011_GWF1_42_40]KKT00468.1 MAG: hypothetical protein UV77_C0003G0014 [Candidatus Nomurabacteria bacterium GW2011_GWA1_43_17]KKT18019.1 MAG: hypothetical protein UW01_C0005G0014 [Candidatus Nomurabacteria bacterium GW2011_GWA2_43_66]OGI74786.1 MAG: hypothetical protein A2740_00410 [Candidatus Nomurabacteria bacte
MVFTDCALFVYSVFINVFIFILDFVEKILNKINSPPGLQKFWRGMVIENQIAMFSMLVIICSLFFSAALLTIISLLADKKWR